jgi:superfamily II DNA or RNA helicase
MGEEELFADTIKQLLVKEQQRQQHETSEAFHLALAVSCFERALMCYEKSDLRRLSNEFYQSMCELEPNTILARVASILCNLYFAVEAGGESTYDSENFSGFSLIDNEKLQTLSVVLTQYHDVHIKNPNKKEINEIMRLIPELQRNAESLLERSGRSGSMFRSSTQRDRAAKRRRSTSEPEALSAVCTLKNTAFLSDIAERFRRSVATAFAEKCPVLRDRRYQLEAYQSHLRNWEKSRFQLITAATGYGKTVFLWAEARRCVKHGIPIIIIAPTADLARQSYDQFLRYDQLSGEKTFSSISVGLFIPKHRLRTVGLVTFITQASYTIQAKKWTSPEAYQQDLIKADDSLFTHGLLLSKHFTHKVVAVDEAHHLVGKKTYPIFCDFKTAGGFCFGVSASTQLGTYPQIDALFPDDESRAVTIPLRVCLERGYVAPLQVVTANLSMYKEAKELSKLVQRKQISKFDEHGQLIDIDQSIEDAYLKNKGFTLSLLALLHQTMKYRREQKYQSKVIVYTSSKKHADMIVEIWNGLKTRLSISAYHGDKPVVEQVSTLKAFKESKLDILVAVSMADEGLDVDGVDIVMDMVLHINMTRRIIQRAGRCVRLTENKRGSVIIAVQLLYKDLQKHYREEIFGKDCERAYYFLEPGQTDKELITFAKVPFCLPSSLDEIKPVGMKVKYPNRKLSCKVGNPPEDVQSEDGPSLNPAALGRMGEGATGGSSVSGRLLADQSMGGAAALPRGIPNGSGSGFLVGADVGSVHHGSPRTVASDLPGMLPLVPCVPDMQFGVPSPFGMSLPEPAMRVGSGTAPHGGASGGGAAHNTQDTGFLSDVSGPGAVPDPFMFGGFGAATTQGGASTAGAYGSAGNSELCFTSTPLDFGMLQESPSGVQASTSNEFDAECMQCLGTGYRFDGVLGPCTLCKKP